MPDKLVLGCGYLGRRIADRWRTQGHRVFASTRSLTRADEFRAVGLEPVVCDVVDPHTLAGLPVETVVWCVGLDRAGGKSMREVHLEGLANVLRALPRPERFLHISSSSVYGQTQGEWVRETDATEPLDESGRTVLEAERVLHELLPDAIILRFAGIYGPGRYLREQALLRGEALVGNAERWLNLIHVEDGADAVLAAEEYAQPGNIYNVCDDRPVTRREFYMALARALHAPEARFSPYPDGGTAPVTDLVNRRLRNTRLREELHLALRYPTFVEGLRPLAEERSA
jgi:nucleoside-diphosphate-sugar epimerase